jgi:uncharacterized protein (TIGR02452 family)
MDMLDDTLQRTEHHWGSARVVDYTGVTLVPRPGNPVIEVTAEKVQDAPLRFRGKRVTVLNFASGVNPGGGVRHGAVAQEEDLCRCSGLLHGLEALPAFYAKNREDEAPPECYDQMIVSEDVPLIKNGYGAHVPGTTIQVITYPAPNVYRDFFAQDSDGNFFPEDKGPATAMLTAVGAIFKRRCAQVIHQATLLGTDVLILGPWGCGAYGNDATVVAEAFKEAVAQHSGGIPHVLFACYGDKSNRLAFRSTFLKEARGGD